MNELFLLNLKVTGIKNIEKSIEIPFYKKTIKNDFNPDQYRIKGIYGENGSGKTAIMTAIKILTKVLLEKNYLNDSVNQKLLNENINKKTGKCAIEVQFYTHLEVGPFIYLYRMELETEQDGRVYLAREVFKSKIGHNSQGVYLDAFETRNGKLEGFFKGEIPIDYIQKTMNLLKYRSFATFVSDIEASGELPDRLLMYHLKMLNLFARNILVDIDEKDDHTDYAVTTLLKGGDINTLHENEDFIYKSWKSMVNLNKQEIMIHKSRISGYEENIERLTAFIKIFKTDLRSIKIDKKEYGDFYICKLIMVYDDYELDQEYESRGIKKLMGLFNALDAACKGYIVFIDELDSNINDVYLGKLLEYFIYYGNGRLCFTAHNLSPMLVLRSSKCAISFISSVNTVHTWTSNGNLNPANAYRDGFIEDSPFNVDASDFLGILGGVDD